MEEKSNFEFKAEIDAQIRVLERQLKKDINKNLIPMDFTSPEFKEYMKIKKVKAMISALRQQSLLLGVRKGERIEKAQWLKEMDVPNLQKQIFISIYQNRMKYQDAAKKLGLPVDEVKEQYERTFKNIRYKLIELKEEEVKEELTKQAINH